MKARQALVLAAVVSCVKNKLIDTSCISKTHLRGSYMGSYFSHEAQIVTEVDSAMQVYGYQECNDEDGNLKAFALILSDESQE